MNEVVNGYPLKKYRLKKWIYENGYTQPQIAKMLGLDVEEFKRKLREREPFNKTQIECLVNLVKAEAAFNIIYFPTIEVRQQVWEYAFGKNKKGERK